MCAYQLYRQISNGFYLLHVNFNTNAQNHFKFINGMWIPQFFHDWELVNCHYLLFCPNINRPQKIRRRAEENDESHEIAVDSFNWWPFTSTWNRESHTYRINFIKVRTKFTLYGFGFWLGLQTGFVCKSSELKYVCIGN